MSDPIVERVVDPAEPVVVERAAPAARVVETVAPAPAVAVVDRWWRFTPAQIIGMIAGAVLVIIGVVALVRGDLQGSINDPVVQVGGWKHTPLLGLIEIGAGVAMLLAASALGAEMFVGAAIAVFGIIALIEPKVLSDNLSIASSLAWLFILLGAVPFIAAAIAQMTPFTTRRTAAVTRVERI